MMFEAFLAFGAMLMNMAFMAVAIAVIDYFLLENDDEL